MAEEESVKNKRRPWLRAVLWVLLTPLTLFVLLMVLLYVPPVQDFIRRQAVSIASESTGLEISVDRIGLRFPLDLVVDGVTAFGRLHRNVQTLCWPWAACECAFRRGLCCVGRWRWTG